MTVIDRTDADLVRQIRWGTTPEDRQALASKEWLVTNGLGGYATGTISGALTRRYHGLLVAALPTPFGRTVMLNYIWEQLRFRDGRLVALPQLIPTTGGRGLDRSGYLKSFRLEAGLPVWEYDVEGVRFEKRVVMPHLQNTTHVSYTLLSSEPVRLELRPMIAFRLPSCMCARLASLLGYYKEEHPHGSSRRSRRVGDGGRQRYRPRDQRTVGLAGRDRRGELSA